LSSLVDVQLAVISRLKREQLIVSRRAARAQSTVDPRVTVTFDQRSFPTKKPINFTLQVYQPQYIHRTTADTNSLILLRNTCETTANNTQHSNDYAP